MSRRSPTWFWLPVSLVLSACGSGDVPPENADATPAYVTAAVCTSCHAREFESWEGSDHDLAMAHAAPETVLGDFDGVVLVHEGVESRFFREGERYRVVTEGVAGRIDTFDVKYTFGVRPLQQYLVELSNGRVQALTIAWDTERKRWFSLHPGERVPPGDWRHWMAGGMNWNHMCADCHSTGLKKNFDLAANAYETTWSDIDVSCESCHGPGEAHVEWAQRPESERNEFAGNGLVAALDGSQRTLIETCAPCHSRRRVIADGFLPGRHYLDHYIPAFIDEQLYYPDGQIKDEVFVYGSFIQSRMYREGVTCSDCHDPHSTRLKREGNDLCTQCHAAAAFDVPKHLNHPTDSPGAECVNCHMPERTYMVVDPRRDHSFKVPRPDLSIELGIPNACNTCHDDRSTEWAREHVDSWYGPSRSDSASYGKIIADARKGAPAAEEAVSSFVRSPDMPAILRATAVTLLGEYDTRKSLDAVKQALMDSEPLVRLGAVEAMESAPDRELYAAVAPLLADTIRAVRVEAARVLARVAGRFPRSSDAPETRAFHAALDEYRESQRLVEDQAAAHLNLAVLDEHFGALGQAESRYRTALRLDSAFVPAHLNLTMLQSRHRERLLASGDSDSSRVLYHDMEKRLRAVLRHAPDLGEAHYTLGLLLAEDASRMPEAADHLSTAARLNPDNARMQYNAGLASQHLERVAEAESFLHRARRLEPDQAEYTNALAILYMQEERWRDALAYTDTLMAIIPPSEDLRRRRAWILERAAEYR